MRESAPSAVTFRRRSGAGDGRRRFLRPLRAGLGGRRGGGGGGPGLGELEEAAADLLGVLRLEDLYPLVDGGWGRAGGGLRGDGEGLGLDGGGGALGLGLRDGSVALGEDAGHRERLHEAAHVRCDGG